VELFPAQYEGREWARDGGPLSLSLSPESRAIFFFLFFSGAKNRQKETLIQISGEKSLFFKNKLPNFAQF
jgi:hypothetical protein